MLLSLQKQSRVYLYVTLPPKNVSIIRIPVMSANTTKNKDFNTHNKTFKTLFYGINHSIILFVIDTDIN